MSTPAKSEIRKMVLARRAALSLEDRLEKSAAVCRRLLDLPEFASTETVLFFIGFGTELDTLDMVAQALAQGKAVAAPQVVRGRPDLTLRRVTDPTSQLQPGTMGILEPGESCPEIPLENINLIIVPAVAWDPEGFRVGYGGGFYDRLLARAARIAKAGIGFECQLVEKVPRAPHDLGVDILITEDRVLRFTRE